MNRAEFRAGLVRLALIAVAAFAIPVAIGLAAWAWRGGNARDTVAWSLSLAALIPLFAGIGVYLTTRSTLSPAELRHRELICAGLLGLGTAMFAAELALR